MFLVSLKVSVLRVLSVILLRRDRFLRRKRFRLCLFVAWSVCVCLSRLYSLLKPINRFRCHLAGTLVESKGTLCQTGSLAIGP